MSIFYYCFMCSLHFVFLKLLFIAHNFVALIIDRDDPSAYS